MLRKLLLLLFLSLFLALPASAQILEGLSGIGFKGGLSFGTLRGEQAEGLKPQVDFAAGAYGQISLSEVLTIQPEVLYARKGASVNVQEEEENVDITINLDYIEIPVLLKAGIPVEAPVVPSIHAGPYLGFAVNREVSAEGGNGGGTESLDGAFSSTDFGVTLGADLNFRSGNRTITLSGQYDLGLSNIVDREDLEDGNNETTDAELSTGAFMLTLGVTL